MVAVAVEGTFAARSIAERLARTCLAAASGRKKTCAGAFVVAVAAETTGKIVAVVVVVDVEMTDRVVVVVVVD